MLKAKLRRDGTSLPLKPSSMVLERLSDLIGSRWDDTQRVTATGVQYWQEPDKPGFTLMPPLNDNNGNETDETLALLLPLLILLSTLLFLLLLFLLFLILVRRQRGIALNEDEGPIDLSREEDREGEGGLVGVENRWLDTVEESVKTGYIRGKGGFRNHVHRCALSHSAAQPGNRSILQTPTLLISHSPNICRYKKKVYRLGPLSRTMKPILLSWFNLVQKFTFSPTG